MSDRIRSLEDALQSLHSEHAADPEAAHPLMQPGLLGIKSTMGLYSGTQGISSDSVPKGNGAPHAMDIDRDRLKLERGSSEDTLATPDNHGARAQVRMHN